MKSLYREYVSAFHAPGALPGEICQTTGCLSVTENLDLLTTRVFDDGGDGFADVGDTIDYTYNVMNSSLVTAANVSVGSSGPASASCTGGNPIPSIASGASVVCTGQYVLTLVDVDAGQFFSSAVAVSGSNAAQQHNDLILLLPAAPAVPLLGASLLTFLAVGLGGIVLVGAAKRVRDGGVG
ncbi:MAG: hypothetical protein GY725_01175 [bacterium]|nr:hypothetical protein [bacterium]